MRVPRSELGREERLPPKFRNAVQAASKNIRKFAEMQLPQQKLGKVRPGL